MAPRSIWKGSITFGLITVPVKIYTAVGREAGDKIDLHLLHEKDGERIHYMRTCDKGHKDIDWDEIVKGYEYSKGRWVEITDEDLDALELETLRTIDVQQFSPYDQIDPMYFDKAYYVVPEESAVKAYRLMVEAMEDEELVGVSKVAIRDREHLSVLRVVDKMMLLETIHWPEEIRDAKFDELRKRPTVQDRERKMARQLIQQLTDDFDPTKFKDEYHKALKKLIDKKVKGEEIIVHEEREEEPAEVVDLLEALKQSVASAKRGEKPKRQRARASGGAKKKKSTGGSKKKTTAKKSSKKKSTGRKKTTRRKSA